MVRFIKILLVSFNFCVVASKLLAIGMYVIIQVFCGIAQTVSPQIQMSLLTQV